MENVKIKKDKRTGSWMVIQEGFYKEIVECYGSFENKKDALSKLNRLVGDDE